MVRAYRSRMYGRFVKPREKRKMWRISFRDDLLSVLTPWFYLELSAGGYDFAREATWCGWKFCYRRDPNPGLFESSFLLERKHELWVRTDEQERSPHGIYSRRGVRLDWCRW